MARDPDRPVEENYPGPPHRVREGDNLFYIHPLTGERFLSVTSALEKVGKEDLDHRWRPGQSVVAAFRELPMMITATLTPACGRTNGECSKITTRKHDWRVRCAICACEKCVPCVSKYLTYEHYRESTRATQRGSALHHWIEDWALNGGNEQTTWAMFRAKCGKPTPDAIEAWVDLARPYVESFLRFVDDCGLTVESWLMSEATVINRTHMFGGTLDARVQINHKASKLAREICERLGHPNPVVSLDTKTREKTDATFWPDNALQLAAYRRGEVVLLPDGMEEPLHPDQGALVVQVRPDGYGWRIPVTDDTTYAGFLGILTAARWLLDHGNESVLVRAHPRQPLPGVEPAAPVKRARKAAAPKATAVPAVPSGAVAADLAAASGRGLVEVELPLDAPAPKNATLDTMRTTSSRSLYNDSIPFAP